MKLSQGQRLTLWESRAAEKQRTRQKDFGQRSEVSSEQIPYDFSFWYVVLRFYMAISVEPVRIHCRGANVQAWHLVLHRVNDAPYLT